MRAPRHPTPVPLLPLAAIAALVASLGAPLAWAQSVRFTDPAPLSDRATYGVGLDWNPDLATSFETWIAVWSSTNDHEGTIGADSDIWFARSPDRGLTWSPPRPLADHFATDTGSDEHPAIATDGQGTWVVAWRSSDPLGGTIGTDTDLLWSRSDDDGITWTAPAPLHPHFIDDDGSDVSQASPALATDGAGTWIVAWDSRATLGDTIGADWDILVARSTDHAMTWSAPAPLDTTAAANTEPDNLPALATDRSGRWIAVWASAHPIGGSSSSKFDIHVARSTDAGATWSAPALVDTNIATHENADDSRPTIATDRAGRWIVAWDRQPAAGDSNIFHAASIDGGATWDQARHLNTDGATDQRMDTEPRLETDTFGNWVAVWRADVSTIITARSTNDGLFWSEPAILWAATDPDHGADGQSAGIVFDGLGTWGVAYDSGSTFGGTTNSRNVALARSITAGLTWQVPRNISPNGDMGDETTPSIATDARGTWIVAFESEDSLGSTIDVDRDILFVRSTDDGDTWTDPAPLGSHAAGALCDDHGVALLHLGAATWLAGWTSTTTLDGTIGADTDIVVVRSEDGGATWNPTASLTAHAAADIGSDGDLALATDGHGTSVAVWASNDSLGGTIDGDWDILVARSTDGGASWTAPAPLTLAAATDTLDDRTPAITASGAATFLVAYESLDPSLPVLEQRTVLITRSTDGGATWSAPAPLADAASTAAGWEARPALANDGRGTIIASWRSTNSLGGAIGTDLDLLLARSTDGGATWSPAVGIGDAEDDASDLPPFLATDGAGTLVVAWSTGNTLDGATNSGPNMMLITSLDGGQTWSDLDPISPYAFATLIPSDGMPRLATNRDGRWIATWPSYDRMDGTLPGSRSRIFVSRSHALRDPSGGLVLR